MTPETELLIRLQDDKIWRIKELSKLVRACNEAGMIRKEALLRASVPLLYAHWEGYFVLAANSYLKFVSAKRFPIADLKDEFWAMAIKKRFNPNQIAPDRAFTKFLLEIRKDTGFLFKKGQADRINGQSNLNSDVLEFCCRCIGLTSCAYSNYMDFIDKDLINKRNHIAHGASLRFDADSVSAYRDKVVDLFRIVQTEIENAVTGETYRR